MESRPHLPGNRNELNCDSGASFKGVQELPPFDRVVFVMSVLERYSDRECSALLNCALGDVIAARIKAIQQISITHEKYSARSGRRRMHWSAQRRLARVRMSSAFVSPCLERARWLHQDRGLQHSSDYDAEKALPSRFQVQLWREIWWTWSGSNRRPLPCHGSALPAAPQAHSCLYSR